MRRSTTKCEPLVEEPKLPPGTRKLPSDDDVMASRIAKISFRGKMRVSVVTTRILILSLFLLLATSVQGFHLGLQRRPATFSTKLPSPQAPSFLFQSPQSEASMVTPSTHQPKGGTTSLAIGFFKQSGLFLLSVILVKLVYSVFFPSQQTQSGGMMDRCPWPFIVFHDPKQFFKDSPTWMIVTYVILLRITKIVGTKGVAA